MCDIHVLDLYFAQPAFFQFLPDCRFVKKRNAASAFRKLFDEIDASGFYKSRKISHFQAFHFQIAFQDIPGAGTGFSRNETFAKNLLNRVVSL